MNFPKAVLFDLDGVLVDACDWHYHALNEALVLTGNSVISREDHETKYNGLPTHIKLEMLGYKKDIEKINKIKQNLTLKIIEKHANIMQEKIELHKYLKSQGIKIKGIYMKDQLPTKLKTGFYVINLQSQLQESPLKKEEYHHYCVYF
jgi:beta-phosphoglucomutase-like phosphatase (HAD superfamily)